MRKKGKGFVEKIALERIYRLFELAEENMARHPERSKRYVELARKIGTRNRVRIPQELKKSFCKKCNSFLKGKNVELEEREKMLVVKCKECGFERKIKGE
ncbi:MAG: ribonuclease P [Candidatus Diapherotrites archaeon]|nr:ribonuclease P [Candidatus Diapherotrites archaeon]